MSGEFKFECLALIKLAIPTILAYASGYAYKVLTVICVGTFLSPIDLGAVSLGTTMVNITGYSIMIGIVSPMETLCSQSHGAKNWELYTITVHRAFVACIAVMIPIWVIYWFMNDIMIITHQNEMIGYKVAIFTKVFILGLPSFMFIAVLRRFLTCQGIAKPLFYFGLIIYQVIHTLLLYLVFIYFKMKDFIYAPICNVLTTWLYVFSVIIYIWYNKHKLKVFSFNTFEFSKVFTWNGNTAYNDKGFKEYTYLAFHGLMSVCAEWWSFECLTFLVGLLGPLPLATHTIYVTLLPFAYMIPLGLGLASASKIGSLIGKEKLKLARNVSIFAFILSTMESIILSLIFYIFRKQIPYLFTHDEYVIKYAIILSPLFVGMVLNDSFQGTSQGILRGIKKQNMSAISVFIGPYCISIPLACILGFKFNYGLIGFWIALNIGYTTMNIFILYVFITYNWSTNTTKDDHKTKRKHSSISIDIINNKIYTSMVNISHFSAFVSDVALIKSQPKCSLN